MKDGAGAAPRVTYRDGQTLQAADLADEQEYLIGMRDAHARSAHRWGVASGLELEVQGDTLAVHPGVAADPTGRQLALEDRVPVSLAELSGNEASVYLLSVEKASAQGASRQLEAVEVKLIEGAPGDPRDATSGGVFLGSVARTAASHAWNVETQTRPQAGLIGASVTASSGAAMMRCGSEFAVSMASDDQVLITANRLRIETDACLMGNVLVEYNSDLTPPHRQGVGLGAPRTEPDSALPWQIYRVATKGDGGKIVNQMIFELRDADEKEDPTAIRASLGFPKQGAFHTALEVAADGSVTIRGDLKVNGKLVESPVSADPSDPRFVIALADAAAEAAGAAGPSTLAVTVGASDPASVGTVPYRLTITNSSSFAVNLLQVLDFATLNGRLVQPEPFQEAVSIRAGGQVTIDRKVTAAEAGMLAIGVRVLGTGLGGIAVAAKGSLQITVRASSGGHVS